VATQVACAHFFTIYFDEYHPDDLLFAVHPS
jgi:hypothetical protein